MNDYLEIFSDVVLLATFQPRHRERCPAASIIKETVRDRPRAITASERRFEGPVRA
jgi:hypothetical protein